jgi:predicted oxidoreductase
MLGLSERGKKRLAYGFWRFTENQVDEAIAMIALVRENGIDHLDTADVYGGASGFGGAEKLLGAVRAKAPRLLDGAVIATKAGCEPGAPYNSSPAYLKAACEASLKRLNMSRIDLFYIHRPDLLAHPADVAGALDDLVTAGKIASVGVSNYTVAEVEALTRYLKAPIRAHQIEFSAGHVTPLFDGTLDQAMKKNLAVAAWSPLARGGLGDGGPMELAKVRATLATLAAKFGVPVNALAIAFLSTHPASVTPILGTTNSARARECLDGLKLTLTRRDWYDIVEAACGRRMP